MMQVETSQQQQQQQRPSSSSPSILMHEALAVSSRVLHQFEQDLKAEVRKGVWHPILQEEEEEGDDAPLFHTLQQCESIRQGLTSRLESALSHAFCLEGEDEDEGLGRLRRHILRESKSVIYSVVSTTAPSTLQAWVSRYYRSAFSRYVEACELRENGTGDDFPLDYEGSVVEVMGQEWCSRLAFVGQTLNSLGLRSMNESIYTDMVFSHIKTWLEERAAGEYTKECLFIAKTYNRKVILEFLKLLLVSGAERTEQPQQKQTEDEEEGERERERARGSLSEWRSRLDYFIYEILGQMRSEEMFDIVVDFPESMQALKDLKVCLEHTNVTDTFIDKFSGQLKRRLLHLGAATPVILAQYISSIKSLNILDPSGILAEIICPLVKKYIKKRKDTTRCIVNMVVYDENMLSLKAEEEEEEEEEEEGEGEGEEEGERGMGMEGGRVSGGMGGMGGFRRRDDEGQDNEDMEDIDIVLRAMQWNPVPIQAAQLFSTLKTCNKDIVSALIDVLGNKEYFIKEYKMILAERLLAKVDDDIDDETRILELLKLRFGANSLRECEIMLKDMADSKRITSNIRALIQQQHSAASNPNSAFISDFSTVIISELFWPPLFEGEVETPKSVQWMLDTFGGQYKALKAPRTLHWKPHLGVVDLELAFGDEIKEFTVSVAQALVISQFETKGTWESEELAAAAGMQHDQLSEKASIWVNSGILTKMVDKQSKKTIYRLVEDVNSQVEKRHAYTKPDVSVMSQEQQMEMNMKVYESYVMGMVTNLESLPLEKIHNMLKMFVLEPVYDKTIAELEAFLAKLVNDGKLTYDGLVYRKKKK